MQGFHKNMGPRGQIWQLRLIGHQRGGREASFIMGHREDFAQTGLAVFLSVHHTPFILNYSYLLG